MIDPIKFMPARMADQTAYAKQMHDVVSDEDFDPTILDFTPGDVTELGTLLAEDQGNTDSINTANAAKKSKTQLRSGAGGSHARLMAKVRDMANTARVSQAPDGTLALIGLLRRPANPTPRLAPPGAPGLTLDNVSPGVVRVRFHDAGSGRPRARAANANGVQFAVVDGTQPETDGEVKKAPIVEVSRSPANLDSSDWPAQVRLYGRWITQSKKMSPWSLPLAITVV